MVIGITGTNGSGKGAVVDYLISKGFVHFSVRATLEAMLILEHTPIDRTALRNRANELRKEYGAGFFGKKFLEEIKEKGITDAVIESVRTTGEAEYLKENGAVILAVDADRKLRYDRIMSRASATDKVDFDTFVREEEREWYGALGSHDMNLLSVIEMADFTIKNEGTLSELYTQVDQMLEKITK